MTIPLNVWTHVAVGNDGTNQKHYSNGIFVEEDACGGDLTINDEDFKIGARGGDGGHGSQFRGIIDEAMLFSAVLSNDDVAAVYGSMVPGWCPNGYQFDSDSGACAPVTGAMSPDDLPSSLVGYWPLNGDGTDIS